MPDETDNSVIETPVIETPIADYSADAAVTSGGKRRKSVTVVESAPAPAPAGPVYSTQTLAEMALGAELSARRTAEAQAVKLAAEAQSE